MITNYVWFLLWFQFACDSHPPPKKKSETKYVGVAEYLVCAHGCPHNINPVISVGFNLDILAEKDNHLAVLFDLYPSLSNLQSANHAAALLIPKQLLNPLKCLLTCAIHPAQWGIWPCIFSNAHDATVASNAPSKTMTECSDNRISRVDNDEYLWCQEQFELHLALMEVI